MMRCITSKGNSCTERARRCCILRWAWARDVPLKEVYYEDHCEEVGEDLEEFYPSPFVEAPWPSQVPPKASREAKRPLYANVEAPADASTGLEAGAGEAARPALDPSCPAPQGSVSAKAPVSGWPSLRASTSEVEPARAASHLPASLSGVSLQIPSDDDFKSCDEGSLSSAAASEREADDELPLAPPPPAPAAPAPPAPARASASARAAGAIGRTLPPQNKNRVSHFAWTEEVLQTIVRGTRIAADAGGASSSPLFLVAGACPNSLCGMQAVLFCKQEGAVDFWWVKPMKSDRSRLEIETLRLHTRGAFKNAPGNSRPVYSPLASLFANGPVASQAAHAAPQGAYAFGVDAEGRAFIDEVSRNGKKTRMLPYLIWQESWSSPLARKQFIRGKLCYRKGGAAPAGADQLGGGPGGFFTRQYEFRDGRLAIAAREDEEMLPSLLPPDAFQEMRELPF